MAWDNSLFQLNNESHQTKRWSTSIHFDEESENLLVLDWQNKECKHRRVTLAEENGNNITTWQINSQEKLLTELDKDSDRVLMMILDMYNIYTKYLNQANHADE